VLDICYDMKGNEDFAFLFRAWYPFENPSFEPSMIFY
jgi:hypothetical protein